MKILIIFFSLIILFAGCSLVDEETTTRSVRLRLLLENGVPTGYLSHPTANDWCPQMVTTVQSGAPITNRYLYFISDRDSVTNKVYSVYRARHVAGVYFENLTQLYATTNQIVSMVVANRSSNGYDDWPDVYLSMRDSRSAFVGVQKYYSFGEGWGLSPEASIDNLFPSEDVVTAGHLINSTNKQYIFLQGSLTGQKVLVPFAFSVTGSLDPVNPLLAYPLALTLNKFKLGERMFLGAWPIVMRLSDGGSAFGFVLSYGGAFYLVFNRNAGSLYDWMNNSPDISGYAGNAFFEGERVASMYAIEHIAGSVDRDPSFDPETGFYFASNRDGSFDLYFVPKSYFQFKDTVE